ncbi:hypothetical protein DICVIV_09664 [Dictyocaulus viviparus]|uniref:Uncharacterized protein n=1 Tax=Dictyocaulus viviparus TaxID=29172 RepID=A0A0D8XKL9_DICVI|nr:hypothetical protein DICVIV_09664 [Dictyocaulus viviparus]
MTVDEALGHPWIADSNLKMLPLTADSLREFKYSHKWLERRVFVQQTPSEQILQAVLAPPVATAEHKTRPAPESARPIEIYDYLRIKERPRTIVEEVPTKRRERSEKKIFDPSSLQQRFDPLHPQDCKDRRLTDHRRQIDQPVSNDQGGRPVRPKKIPLDQFGRLFRPEDLARIPHDSFGRPLDLDQRLPVDQLGRIVQLQPEELKKLANIGPCPQGKNMDSQFLLLHEFRFTDDQKRLSPDVLEKKQLVPQMKGEAPSKKEVKTISTADYGDEELPHVPLRMIRGEHREIEEEIANRILSDISEESSINDSLGAAENDEVLAGNEKLTEILPRPARSRSTTPRAESDASTPTVSQVSTVKEGDFYTSIVGLPESDRKSSLFIHTHLAVVDSRPLLLPLASIDRPTDRPFLYEHPI